MDVRTPPEPDPRDGVWFEPPDDVPGGAYGPGPELDPADAWHGSAGPVPQTFPTESFVFGSGRGGNRGVRALLAIGLVLVVVAGTLVFWFSRSGSGGVALALDMTTGQTMGYAMTISMHGNVSAGGRSQAVTAQVAGDIGWKVLSVDADGTATVALHLTKLTAQSGSKSAKLKAVTTTVKISNDGRLLSGTDLSAFGPARTGVPGGSQFMPILPDHPVKPGDSWSQGYEQASGLGYGTVSIHATGTLVKFESEGGHQVAVVQTTETIPIHLTIDVAKLAKQLKLDASNIPASAKIAYSGSVNVETYSWVDTATKQLRKSSSLAKFDLDMAFQGFGAAVPEGSVVSFDGSFAMALTAKAASGS
jgi:hypothetical protein